MKPLGVIATVILLAAAAWLYFANLDEEGQPDPPVVIVDPDPPTSTTQNSEEVFQRAFWRHPSENDTILHAKRSEWADADGVDRWQWFIAVDPSTELTTYLIEQNAFSLSKVFSAETITTIKSPEWFPKSADSLQLWQSLDGDMLLFVEMVSGRLFATGKGYGFAKAVGAQAVPTPPQSPSTSRLPITPPPNRNDP